MWKRNRDFKPDRTGPGLLSRLYLTERQRKLCLKWFLFCLVLVAVSLLQDVIFSQVRILGTKTDLTSSAILLLCMMLSPESCAVFALIASTGFFLSGAAAGPYVIVFLTMLGTTFNIFRCAYLRKSFSSTVICAGTALIVYKLLVFAVGLFLGHTTFSRLGAFCVSGVISVVPMPALYPLYRSIGKIGGESWKE